MTDKPKGENEKKQLESRGFFQRGADSLTGFGDSLVESLGKATGLSPAIDRLKGLGKDGESDQKKSTNVVFQDGNNGQFDTKDTRIKIKIPNDYLFGPAGYLRQVQDNAVVFPYTPQIVVQTRANYNTLHPTHSNYAFYAYQNSALDAISIVGTFSAQNQNDAKYMLGAIHALRAVTKMSFGASRNNGAPPPVCLLDGYGTYQFNNLPVVISSFFYTLNEDVDYITAFGLDDTGEFESAGQGQATRIPTRAEFTIECLPAFSRRDQATFSIENFIFGLETQDKGMI